MPDIVSALRAHQERDPALGTLFLSLHAFSDRLYEEFYSEEPELPKPVVAMEKDRGSRLGFYTFNDGYALVNRINLNPYAIRNGTEAAEVLAHEIVHLWQAHIGRPCLRNYHGSDFHKRMRVYGIMSRGKTGYHAGYVGDNWHNFMERCADLELSNFILPGIDKKPGRNLLKLQCPDCGNSVRNRNVINIICGDCSVPFELVKAGKTS